MSDKQSSNKDGAVGFVISLVALIGALGYGLYNAVAKSTPDNKPVAAKVAYTEPSGKVTISEIGTQPNLAGVVIPPEGLNHWKVELHKYFEKKAHHYDDLMSNARDDLNVPQLASSAGKLLAQYSLLKRCCYILPDAILNEHSISLTLNKSTPTLLKLDLEKFFSDEERSANAHSFLDDKSFQDAVADPTGKVTKTALIGGAEVNISFYFNGEANVQLNARPAKDGAMLGR